MVLMTGRHRPECINSVEMSQHTNPPDDGDDDERGKHLLFAWHFKCQIFELLGQIYV